MNDYDDIKNITIIGAGQMGHGIAEVCAIARYNVVLYDIHQKQLNQSIKLIEKSLLKLAKKRKVWKNQISSIIGKIFTTTDFKSAMKKPELIIEAIPENLTLKKEIFEKIDDLAPNNAIITTNTSYFDINEIAENVSRKDKIVVTHFFNPVAIMEGLEIVKGKFTTKQTIHKILRFAENINRKAKIVGNSPGFVVNRIQAAPQILLTNAVAKKFIKPEEIDTEMKRLGMPMGAFEIMDFTGLDTVVHGMTYLSRKLGPDYQAPQWMIKLVNDGKLGRKTNQGIYNWKGGKAIIPSSKFSKVINVLDMMLFQINEATKILQDGTIKYIEDIDDLIQNGTGNSIGIFGTLKTIGIDRAIIRCTELSRKFELEALKPTKLLLNWESEKTKYMKNGKSRKPVFLEI